MAADGSLASALPDSRLEALLDYWRGCKGGKVMPPRSAIEMVNMPSEVLPYLMLTDIWMVGGQRRYQYRLFGSEMVEAAKGDMTWQFLDECVPKKNGYRDYVLALYESVVQERRPLYSSGDFIAHGAPERPERSTQRLMLPLGTEDEGVTHVLSGQVFTVHGCADGHPMDAAAAYREYAHRFLHTD